MTLQRSFKTILLVLSLLAISAPAANPVISNVRATQRSDSKLVDIWYDVADSDGDRLSVSVSITDNGISVPAASLSGSIGSGVAPGTGKQIIWNAGADWSGHFSENVRVSIVADDTTPVTWIFSDDFNRPNSGTVGNGWSQFDQFGYGNRVSIVNGALHIDDYPSNAGHNGVTRPISAPLTHLEFRVKTLPAGQCHVFAFNYNGWTGGWSTQNIPANTWVTITLKVNLGLRQVDEYVDGVYVLTEQMTLGPIDQWFPNIQNAILIRSAGTEDNIDIYYDYIRWR